MYNMDFYTDPEMGGTAPITDIPSKIELKTDDKTEERFDKLETSIEKSFNVLTNRTSEGVTKLMENPLLKNISSNTSKHFNEQLSNLTKNLNLNEQKNEEGATDGEETSKDRETLSSKAASSFNFLFQKIGKAATDYLNDLDTELEQVENVSLDYANKMGSFIKTNIIEGSNADENLRDFKMTQANRGELSEDESKLLFNYIPELNRDEEKTKVFATRTEAEIHNLETQEQYYLKDMIEENDFQIVDYESDKGKEFEKISKLLEEKKDLQKLMADLVPSKISFNEFWSKYFYQHDKILQKEQERKKMLQEDKHEKDRGNGDDDEEFNWDDDEDVDDDEE